MANHAIDHSHEPILLFKSSFLEFFTHIHPVVIVVIWLPVALYFFMQALISVSSGYPIIDLPIGIFTGLFFWTFAEYTLHRFVFHFKPKAPWQERLSFIFHGVHHAQPQCKTRLVMPPAVSIPLALMFYGFFYLLFDVVAGSPGWIAPIFSGFITGYLIYDLTHYATHHFPMRTGYLKFLKRYHNQHHYKTPNQRFGVSTPLWDIVFGTKPE